MAQSRVRALEEDVREGGVSSVNNVVKLLRTMREDDDDDDEGNSSEALTAMHALRRTFSQFLEQGDLCQTQTGKRGRGIEEGDKDDDQETAEEAAKKDKVLKFTRWLREKYVTYCKLLAAWLRHEKDTYQVAALRTLMHLVQRDAAASGATTATFGVELYTFVVRSLVEAPIAGGLESQLLRTLRDEYIVSYTDVRYYTLVAVQRICAAQSQQRPKALNEEDNEEEDSNAGTDQDEMEPKPVGGFAALAEIPRSIDRDVLGENVFDLLYATPSEVDADDFKDSTKAWVPRVKGANKRAAKLHRRAFQGAWLAFLQLGDFSPRVYRRVLVCLPKRVVPYLQDPLLLSDFLTDAYEQRGPTAMLALNSLFQLMMEHHLDYPDFYPKLYRLLDHDTFHVKHRAQFFELLSRVMASTHLASYLVAAFAKRIARLALYAPPSGAMFAVVLIGNLLKRHPTCLTLLHRPTATELKRERGERVEEDADFDKRAKIDAIKEASLRLALGPVGGDSEDQSASESESENEEDGGNEESKDSVKTASKGTQQRKKTTTATTAKMKKRKLGETLGALSTSELTEDPFDIEEQDPSKCGAVDSCLWEIQALSKHYCPKVASLVHSIFETEIKASMESKKIQPPVPLDDFVAITYKSLFDQELRRGQKRRAVALNFVAPDKAEVDDVPAVFSLV
ncbi:Nucleolar complex protein 4-like [Hondaea fermentalgiana]|uniref:Nucleolar complex protein 4-like n=1 Tax=Hondaea fermentalgiana TaxID=2315210 RepID=A0A2R5GNZ3_9STRA|nr:Nucleolar complex protein 4-like [Hondaea fermentalgiana]|eukprot:GBG31488.1 Nucleolar complex protein 4-like [Hondaea fermentalgiana]